MSEKANTCVVCGGQEFSVTDHPAVGRTPYLSCKNCGLWAQYPAPVFRWESARQPLSGRDAMTDPAKWMYDDLAARLIQKHHPGSVLDIGTPYPYLLHCFKNRGVETILGIDDFPEIEEDIQELDVPMVYGNFLTTDFGSQKFDLITIVHYIEHFSNPTEAINKSLSLLTDKGVIYIRTPEVNQDRANLYLTPECYPIHPILFSKKAFRLMCENMGLSVFDEWEQPSSGQVDWMIRREEDVRISFCVISCNERAVIGRMLDSITPIAWEVIVYLNNCTDRTPDIIKRWSERTGVRHRIIDGYWDNNFARAKNEAILAAEGTHVAWMDCDDVLSPDAPEKIKAAIKSHPDCPQDWRLIYGGDTLFHLRLWKNEARPFKPHFHDSCHEYVALGEYNSMRLMCNDITLEHLPQPKDATGRNSKILREAKSRGPQPCPYCGGELDGRGRILFYLGNTLREGGKHEEALKCYDAYLEEKLGWHDEIFWAWMYKGQAHYALYDMKKNSGNTNEANFHYNESMVAWCRAIAVNSHWAEPYMAIARVKYNDSLWKESIAWSLHASAQTRPHTLMFVNTGAYKDQPWRLISWCYEHMGDLDRAIHNAEIAASMITEDSGRLIEDKEWEARIVALRSRRGAVK